MTILSSYSSSLAAKADGAPSSLLPASGTLADATFLDIATEFLTPGDGLYYVVEPLGCGSWQTMIGNEPGRDPGLP